MRHPEHHEQVVVVKFCELRGIPVFAIPNGGNRDAKTGAFLKAEGVRAGVPDLFIPVPRGGYHGMFIEMKAQGGRKPTGKQKVWLDLLDGQGYMACWARGADDAIDKIEEYFR